MARPPRPPPPPPAPGQWKLLDVVDADDLSDAEAAEMLQRLDVTEARHRVQQLNGGGRKPWKQKKKKNNSACNRTPTPGQICSQAPSRQVQRQENAALLLGLLSPSAPEM